MHPMAADTPLHVEQEIMALLRTMSFADKGRCIAEMGAGLDQLALTGIRMHRRPLDDYVQLALRRIDPDRHARVLPLLQDLSMTAPANPVAIAVCVGQILSNLSIPYYVGGSFASSLLGDYRAIRDIDIILQTPPAQQLRLLIERLKLAFTFLDSDVYDAHARCSDPDATFVSFGIYDRTSGYQVDIFLAPNDTYSRTTFMRLIEAELVEGTVWIPALEDAILGKLRWYQETLSDQQWRDVQGMLRVQRGNVDLRYIRLWESNLGIPTLVEAAMAGEKPRPPEQPERL